MVFFYGKRGCFTFTLHISYPVFFTCYNTILSNALHTHRLVGMTSFHIVQILKTRDTTSVDLYACIQLFSENCTTATETCQLHNP